MLPSTKQARRRGLPKMSTETEQRIRAIRTLARTASAPLRSGTVSTSPLTNNPVLEEIICRLWVLGWYWLPNTLESNTVGTCNELSVVDTKTKRPVCADSEACEIYRSNEHRCKRQPTINELCGVEGPQSLLFHTFEAANRLQLGEQRLSLCQESHFSHYAPESDNLMRKYTARG